MTNTKAAAIGFFSIAMVCGCSSFTSPARYNVLQRGTPYWVDYDSTRRGTILIPKEGSEVAICAEPSPDVALAIVDRFKGSVGTGKVDVAAEADVEENVIQLAKRTQTIMFLRESLYRLCEMSLNNSLKADQVVILYDKVIETASKVAEAELVNAKAAQEKAQARKFQIMQQTPGFIEEYIKGLPSK